MRPSSQRLYLARIAIPLLLAAGCQAPTRTNPQAPPLPPEPPGTALQTLPTSSVKADNIPPLLNPKSPLDLLKHIERHTKRRPELSRFGSYELLQALGPVSTLAGTGEPGFKDGPGPLAQFNNPFTSVCDAAGNAYVADFSNHRIRKIDRNGVVSTFAGTGTYGHVDGPGHQAQFGAVQGIGIDGQGNLIVSDLGNLAIRKITPEGNVSTIFAPGPDDQFRDAFYGCTVDRSGNVYIACHSNIIKINPVTGPTRIAGIRVVSGSEMGYADGPGETARFNGATDVAVDSQGNVFVADCFNNAIRKITPEGHVSTFAGGGTGGYMDGPTGTSKLYNPFGLGVDKDDNVYVADLGNSRIRKITPAGHTSTIAGDGAFGYRDGPSLEAQFYGLADIAIDDAGRLIIPEYFSHRIRQVAVGGELSLRGDQPNAFSPNGDGEKDEYRLEISASSDWTLKVDGHDSPIATGTGQTNQAIRWNGKVDGTILPDGKYTLRLKAGEHEKFAEVVVDTQAPEILNGQLVKDPNDPQGNRYILTGTIKERGLAGLTQSPVKISALGATITEQNLEYDPASGNFRHTSRLNSNTSQYKTLQVDEDENCIDIGYYVEGDDVTGNKAQKEFHTEDSHCISLYIDKEIVSPLDEDEFTYSHYKGRASTRVTALVVDRFGLPLGNKRVTFSAKRSDPYGHDHPNPPVGQFSLNGSYTRGPANESANYRGENTAQVTAVTDIDGNASIYYLPYGFSGEETIQAQIMGSASETQPGDRVAKASRIITIAVTSLTREDYTGLADTRSITSHDALYALPEVHSKFKQALTQFKSSTGWIPSLTGMSVQGGGPYDNASHWVFTKFQGQSDPQGNRNHLSHRDGKSADIATDDIAVRFNTTFEKVYWSRRFWKPFMKAGFTLELYRHQESHKNWHFRYIGREVFFGPASPGQKPPSDERAR